jgi:hypothetical protein
VYTYALMKEDTKLFRCQGSGSGRTAFIDT